MTARHVLGSTLIALTIAISPAVVTAAPKSPPKVTGSGNGAAAASAANAQLEKAKATLDDLTKKMRTKFEASPEYIAATAAVKQSTATYSTASAKFIATLQTKDEYKAVVAAKIAAQAKVDAMRKDPAIKPDVVAAAQSEAIDAGKAVTQFQTDAMNADSALSLLKDDVTISAHNLETLKRHFETSMADDPTWAAAKVEVDKAQVRLNAARARL